MKQQVIIRTGLSRKGAQYADRKQRQLFTCILWLIAVCLMVWAWCEPAAASSATGYGLSVASMALIGSLDDVSDRETHGSEIAYQVVLIEISQLADKFSFPQPAANSRTVTIGKSILKAGEAAHYFEAHTIPTLVTTSEKGDITTNGTNTFTFIMGGDRVKLKNFVEEYSGGKFIILYKHIKETTWHILGEAERPMVLGNTEMKDDADGRYTTLTFTRNSVYLDLDVEFDYVAGQTGDRQTIQDLLTGTPAAQGGAG